MMKKIFTLLSICVLAIFTACHTVSAQSISNVAPTEVNVEFTPEVPVANQYVEVNIESYGTNLNTSKITWYINGKIIESGIGIKFFSFTTGKTNTTTALDINIVTQTGELIKKTYRFKPSNVDLIWQAYGYTPPFYKGKTLFSHQNKIKFVAMPHIIGSNGSEVPAGNLIYKWTRNGTVLGDFSGYGKSTYTYIGSIVSRPLQIDVEVTSLNSNDIARATVDVTPIEPKIVFYEKDPLYGIQFQKALSGDITMTGSKEIEILAQPFFFGVINADSYPLIYKWSINNTPIEDDGINQISRVFRQKEGASGSSYISLSIENPDKILQYTTGGFNLKFENTAEQTL